MFFNITDMMHIGSGVPKPIHEMGNVNYCIFDGNIDMMHRFPTLLIPVILLITIIPAFPHSEGEIWIDSPDKELENILNGVPLEYVIITTGELETSFDELARWKSEKGVPARVFTLDGPGGIFESYPSIDGALSIRLFLQNLTDSEPALKWVLLGGDSDVVPVRYINVGAGVMGYDDLYLSDLYFANPQWQWDHDGDGVYGEEDKDWAWTFLPLNVGRLPVGNGSQADLVVDRIISYETSPAPGNWTNTALVWGSLMDSPNDPDDYDDYKDNAYKVKKEALEFFPQNIHVKEYYDYPQIEGGNYSPETDTLDNMSAMASLNQGCSLLNFAGQAFLSGEGLAHYNDPTGMANISSYLAFHYLLRSRDIDNLTNGDMPPFMFMPTCSMADFTEEDDSNLERLLTAPGGGAIGYISNTNESYRGETFEGYSIGNWWMDRAFWEIFFAGANRPGAALDLLKERYVKEKMPEIKRNIPSHVVLARANLAGLNLLGDPEIPIWHGIPRDLTSDIGTIYHGSNGLSLLILDEIGIPQSNATVCIHGNGLYWVSVTGSDGTVYFDQNVSAQPGTDITITITANCHLPMRTVQQVIRRNAPDQVNPVVMEEDPSDPTEVDLWQIAFPDDNVPKCVDFLAWAPGPGWQLDVTNGRMMRILPPPDLSGNYSINVSVDGEAFSFNMTIPVTVESVNDPPQTESGPHSFSAILGEPSVFSLSAWDPDGDILTASLDYAGASFDPRTMEGTIIIDPDTVSSSPLSVNMTITDGKASMIVPLSFHYIWGNRPPHLTSDISDIVITVNEDFFILLNAYDPDGDFVRFSDDSSLFDVDPSTGKISFTPEDADVGTHGFNITLDDGNKTTVVPGRITVKEDDSGCKKSRVALVVVAVSISVVLLALWIRSVSSRKTDLQNRKQEKTKKTGEDLGKKHPARSAKGSKHLKRKDTGDRYHARPPASDSHSDGRSFRRAPPNH